MALCLIVRLAYAKIALLRNNIRRGGEVVNTAVCRTAIRRFESDSRLRVWRYIMAGERLGGSSQENFANKTKAKGKEIVLFVAEKSVYVTLPLTAGLFAAGMIPLSTALLFGGADVVGSKVAGNMRRKK